MTRSNPRSKGPERRVSSSLRLETEGWPVDQNKSDASENGAVVVVGASPSRDRYSNRAVRDLLAGGYRVIPVHPSAGAIEGLPAIGSLAELTPGVDTITMYVNPVVGMGMVDDLRRLEPRRVILNPGAESEEIVRQLEAAGIEVVCECTLVMLRVGRF